MSDMALVFTILGITTISFAIPRFRADLVALCSLLALFLAGVISVPEALAGFSSSVVIMLAVLFIVGEGISQTGIADRAGNLLVKLTGNSEFKMLLFVKIIVAGLGCFISNTGTVAILMPIVINLSIKMNVHPGKLLMPLAFGASMGGALTLIGTAPNLLAREALINNGFEGLAFFDFTPIGLAILAVGIAYMWFVGRKMLNKPVAEQTSVADSINTSELLRQYGIKDGLSLLKLTPDSSVIGKSFKEIDWSNEGITVLKVAKYDKATKKLSSQQIITPEYVICPEDAFLVYSSNGNLENILSKKDVIVEQSAIPEGFTIKDENIAEIILTPQSNFINKTLKDMSFRGKYGLTVLAMKCVNRRTKKIGPNTSLDYGDALLVYGGWDDIDTIAQDQIDLVVINRQTKPPVAKNPMKALLAGVILLGMVIALVTEVIPAVMTVMVAGLLMILTGSVKGADRAYKAVNWNIVVLIACMLPMATALENTGGVSFIADGITSVLGEAGPIVVMAGLYVITSLFGVFISNTATAVLFLPVAILAAADMGVSPLPFVMAVTYAASMSFATPVSTPPNAMVMVAGKYKFTDYVKVGVPLQLVVGIVVLLLLPVVFPF